MTHRIESLQWSPTVDRARRPIVSNTTNGRTPARVLPVPCAVDGKALETHYAPCCSTGMHLPPCHQFASGTLSCMFRSLARKVLPPLRGTLINCASSVADAVKSLVHWNSDIKHEARLMSVYAVLC